MPHDLIAIITSDDAAIRNRSLDGVLPRGRRRRAAGGRRRAWTASAARSENLYERVRAIFFLAAIYRYHLPEKLPAGARGLLPFEGYAHLLNRRFEESVDEFLAAARAARPQRYDCQRRWPPPTTPWGFRPWPTRCGGASARSAATSGCSAWAIRPTIRWRSARRCCRAAAASAPFPILVERTPVRMDLSHSGWSDIFFLGMDFPEGARVLNVSVDLGVRGRGPPAAAADRGLPAGDRPAGAAAGRASI